MDAPTARRLCTRVLEVRYELLALLRLLDAREDHFRALDVLLRREQVVEQRVLAPNYTGVFVCVRERVARGLAGLAAEDAVPAGRAIRDSMRSPRHRRDEASW